MGAESLGCGCNGTGESNDEIRSRRVGDRDGPQPCSRSLGSVPDTIHGVKPGMLDAVDTGLLIATGDGDSTGGGVTVTSNR